MDTELKKSELKIKLVFWRLMSFFAALGCVLYFVKYDFDIVFLMIFTAFAMMFKITQAIKKLL